MSLARLNSTLEKLMPLITPTSVLIGFLLSQTLSPYTGWVPWIFAIMTFSGSLSMNFQDLRRVLQHPLPIVLFLIIIHALMPLAAWLVGSVAFPDDALMVTGLILLLAIPTGIISFMWVSIYRGNIALTLTMILIDTILSPFLVPTALSALVGTKVKIDVLGMMTGLFWMIIVPSMIGMLLNQWTQGRIKTSVGPVLAPFSKLGIALVVSINSSAISGYITEFSMELVYLFLICVIVVSCGYLIGYGSSKLLKFGQDVDVTMTFNCGMRNISAGAVLAITYFPPQVAMPVIIGMCFQQMMASLFGFTLFRRRLSEAEPKLAIDTGAHKALKS